MCNARCTPASCRSESNAQYATRNEPIPVRQLREQQNGHRADRPACKHPSPAHRSSGSRSPARRLRQGSVSAHVSWSRAKTPSFIACPGVHTLEIVPRALVVGGAAAERQRVLNLASLDARGVPCNEMPRQAARQYAADALWSAQYGK
jgi:hypothetical protein